MQIIGSLGVVLTGITTGFHASFAKAKATMLSFEKSVAALSTRMATFGRMASVALTLPILGIGAIATKSFASFDDAMRNVNVIAKESENQFQKTSDAVLKMAGEMGKPPTELAKALYNINSASRIGAEGMVVLQAATEAAKAGVADVDVAARALTNILNAYGMETSRVGDVSDILFKTVEKGVLTFDDLANNIGTVAASAAIAKVPIEEVAAAMATMTRGGISANISATALNNLLLQMISPSEKLAAAFKNTAEGSGSAMLASRGLAGTLEWMAEVTGGNLEAYSELIPSIRAIRAAFSTARNEGKDFAGDMAAIATAEGRAGATAAALAEQSKSLGSQMRKLSASAQVLWITIGKDLGPVVRRVTTFLKGMTGAYALLSPAVRRVVIGVAMFLAAIGPAALLMNVLLKTLLVALGVFTKFIPALFAMKLGFLTSLSPLLALGLGIFGVIAFMSAFIGKGETMRDRFLDTVKQMREAWEGFLKVLHGSMEKKDQVSERFLFWSLMAIEAKYAAIQTSNAFSWLFGNLGTAFGWLTGNWSSVVQYFQDNWLLMVKNLANGFVAFVKGAASSINDLSTAIAKWVVSGFREWDYEYKGIMSDFKPLPLFDFEGSRLELRDLLDEAGDIQKRKMAEINDVLNPRKMTVDVSEWGEGVKAGMDVAAAGAANTFNKNVSSMKYAGAATAGSVEAYKTSIQAGGTSAMDKVAKGISTQTELEKKSLEELKKIAAGSGGGPTLFPVEIMA